MHNYESVPDNVRGIIEFNDKGKWVCAVGNKQREPYIFENKAQAIDHLGNQILRISMMALLGHPIRIPMPEEFRFVPVEVPQSFDHEPIDMMAASDVLKAAIAKAKSGGAV